MKGTFGVGYAEGWVEAGGGDSVWRFFLCWWGLGGVVWGYGCEVGETLFVGGFLGEGDEKGCRG